MPAPEEAKIGEDYSKHFGITHYQLPEQFFHGESIKGPSGLWTPKYDVENMLNPKFSGIIKDGEEVYISEKTHGASSKFVYFNDQFWIGSRTNWKKWTKKPVGNRL